MNTLFRFTLLITMISFVFVSCDSKPERPESVQSTSATPASTPSPDFTAGNIPEGLTTTTTTTTTPDAAAGTGQNAAGEYHYNCPKGCAGGAAGAGKCATCGGDLVHNQAYHAAPGTVPDPGAASTTATPQFNVTGLDGQPTQIQTPPAAATAQNANGEYHYTCPKGCAGGAAGAGKCASCGGDLAHNQAFHN